MASRPAPLDTLLASLKPWLNSRVFKAGDTIFSEGDSPNSCFFIKNGRARAEIDQYEIDSDSVLGYFESGEIFGEVAFLDGKPRSASVSAETDLAADELTRDSMTRIMAEDPALALRTSSYFGAIVASRLREISTSSEKNTAPSEIDEMVEAAAAAQKLFKDWGEDRVSPLLENLAYAISEKAEELAKLTVDVTRLGNVADKTLKNKIASLNVFSSIQDQTAIGVLNSDPDSGVTELGESMGVVFALVPQTNPVATAIFKTLIAIKSRNALILSFHRAARPIADVFGELIQDVLAKHQAPINLISWVKKRNSRRKTEAFFHHPGVSLILATGGSSMVRSAYSSGRPAIGVGPGNTPTLICSDCDLKSAAEHILNSKSFDNGLICGSEHNLVVIDEIYEEFKNTLIESGAAVITSTAERQKFLDSAYHNNHLRRDIVGADARFIASKAGVGHSDKIKVLIVETEEIKSENPLAREKMAPIIGMFRAKDFDDGISICSQLLEIEGTGHTAVIHSNNQANIESFARAMPAGRILVNSPAAQGIVGLTTSLVPSLTLGCGTFGGTSTTDNITYSHLLNVKRLAYYREPTSNS